MRLIDTADFAALGWLHRIKLRLHGAQVAYPVNADACRSRGLCVMACPEQAITLARAAQSSPIDICGAS